MFGNKLCYFKKSGQSEWVLGGKGWSLGIEENLATLLKLWIEKST